MDKSKQQRVDSKKRERRLRKKDSVGNDDDPSSSEDEVVIRKRIYTTATQNETEELQVEEDEVVSEERSKQIQMDKDIADRDAFITRLINKDDSKTSKTAAATSTETTKSVDTIDYKDMNTIDILRETSRQHYLEKREEKQLQLLELSMKEEEELFTGVALTKEERKRIEIQQEVLKLAKDKQRFNYKDDGYNIPDKNEDEYGRVDKKKQEAMMMASRYVEEEKVKTDQQQWEEDIMKASKITATAAPSTGNQKVYEYVFEDEIEFVSQQIIDGKLKASGSKNEIVAVEEEEEEESVELMKARLTPHEKILLGRKKLPVYVYREEFLKAVQDNRVLVIVGETGSGKTTQIPQYLHEVGWSKIGKIGCTQPRRVAAMSVAARVSQEMNVKLGQEVGYSIRFEDCTSDSTIIKYMTDGMLLREFLTEPDLKQYSVMIIDEAHERTLHTDILFGLVKDVARARAEDDNFRLIISSATLDAQKFATYFDNASIMMIPGRMFDVDILYTKQPEANYLDAVVVTVLQIHYTQAVPGDILAFLPGQEEIETVAEILNQRLKGLGTKIKELVVCPIYSNLPSDMQAMIFQPTSEGSRKVILGTNIAETSLTIDGICYVIDTGLCKQKSYNVRTGMESLTVTPISQAAANQRKGRAGRTQAGKCFRLYTSWAFQNELEVNTIPEILRTNMANVVLMLKSLGINDLINFDFMDAPPAQTLIIALEQLYALGAVNDRCELTKMGRRMAEFPLDPMMSKSLIISETYKCSEEILTILSMLSVGGTVFYRPKEKAVHADTARLNFARGGGGDHLTLMRCYNDWVETNYSTQWCYENYVQHRALNKARDIREQLEGLCDRVEVVKNSNPIDVNSICKALVAGYFFNTAKLANNGEYKTVKKQQTVYIHPSSVLSRDEEPPKWLTYFELTYTTKEYMRMVAPIQGEWLVEIAPHYYSTDIIAGDSNKGRNNPRGKGKASIN